MDETRVQHGLSGQGAVDTVGDRRCPSVRLVTDIHVSGSAKDAKDDQDKCLALLIAHSRTPVNDNDHIIKISTNRPAQTTWCPRSLRTSAPQSPPPLKARRPSSCPSRDLHPPPPRRTQTVHLSLRPSTPQHDGNVPSMQPQPHTRNRAGSLTAHTHALLRRTVPNRHPRSRWKCGESGSRTKRK